MRKSIFAAAILAMVGVQANDADLYGDLPKEIPEECRMKLSDEDRALINRVICDVDNEARCATANVESWEMACAIRKRREVTTFSTPESGPTV